MKTPDTTNAKAKDERLAKLYRKLESAIAAKAPTADAIFAEAYDMVETAIRRGVSHKEIISLLNEIYGLKLHSATFRELLKKEREARTDGTRAAKCPMCDQVLAASDDVPATAPVREPSH